MHALEAQDSARPAQVARTSPDIESDRARSGHSAGSAALWLAVLLVIVSLSLADGLINSVVAYERDTAVFYFPLMSWVAQQLQQGHLPLWTPQFFGGYPIFADGEIGLAYPPVLLALLTLPPERAFVVLRLLHLSIAAVGMFVLARTWRLPYPSAALAGVVFTLGSFLQAQIHHENIIRTAAWLPLVLAFVELALRARSRPAKIRWTALAAVALGLAGLSLHSQMLVMALLVLAAYGAFRWAIGPLALDSSATPGWRMRFVEVASVCVPVVVVGLGLAAAQLAPLLELAGFSARGSGMPYTESAAYSLTPVGLLQVIFPYLFRGPGNAQWGLWTHWESYIYIGLAPLVLVLVALVAVRRREVYGWGILGGVGLILALGQYSPLDLHYVLWLVPGLSSLRAPGRFTLVVVLAGAMLAAYGLTWLMEKRRSTGSDSLARLTSVLAGATAVIAAATLAIHLLVLVWPDAVEEAIKAAYLSLPRDSYPLTSTVVLKGLSWSTDPSNPRVLGAILGLAAVIAALWRWQRSSWHGWPALFVGFTAIDLLLFGWAVHPREPLATIAAEPAAVQALERFPSPDAAPNRVLASPALNQVAADRLAPFGSLQEANGYSSLQFIWHRDYLNRVLYADDGLLDLWGVGYVIDPARYGTLSNYQGVNFLPQQALLHAPGGGALAEQRFTLTGTSPITELRVVTALNAAVGLPQGTPVAQVDLLNTSEQVVGRAELQAGRDTMEWAWDVPSVQAVVQHQRVESAGTTREAVGPEPRTRNLSYSRFTFDPAVEATTVVVRATLPTGEFVLYGGSLARADGTVEQLFGKTKSKYREVYADSQIRVLENTAASPRAFLVPTARVASSLGTALNLMVHEPFQPDQVVILADETSTQATRLPTDRGGHGVATVTAYAADNVRVHTSASGDAWLVLSDTYYPGWTATVDGESATVLRGDVLFRVVPVPAGEHDVEFRFEPGSVKLGLAISVVSLLVILGALLLAGRAARSGITT